MLTKTVSKVMCTAGIFTLLGTELGLAAGVFGGWGYRQTTLKVRKG